MTTREELLAADPDPAHGYPTDIPAGPGAVWRWFVELADPEAGSGIVWHDFTGPVSGVYADAGTTAAFGSARAGVSVITCRVPDDRLAPWNPDTSPMFGVHVRLGAGLLVRAGLMRVAGGVVTDPLIRFTHRVERWGGSSEALGRIRRHQIIARDLSANLAKVKVANSIEHNWPDRVAHTLTGWPNGVDVYGAVLDDATDPVLPLPAREQAAQAVTELDATVGPAGAVWYTNRRGRLIVRPQIGDTWHADLFTAGASGTPWVDPTPVVFSWAAAADGGVAYIVEPDTGEPFDIDDDEQGVANVIDVTVPEDLGYNVDDAGSIDRHDERTLPLEWQVRNDAAADDLLARRAYASSSARPLVVTHRQTGFLTALGLEWGHPVEIRHTSRPGRQVVTATGHCRRTVDDITPHPGGRIEWRLAVEVDVAATDATDPLLPPEALVVGDLDDGYALFDWTDPAQAVTPTVTQVRMIGQSDIWLDLDYPIGELAWLWLPAEATFRFEVRYLVVDDGLVTHVSPAATVTFTTPAPEDPDEPATPPWTDDGGPVDPPEECTTAVVLEDPPFDDESLVVFFPVWCPPGQLLEAVTEAPATPGPALAGYHIDGDDQVWLTTDELTGSVAYGASDLLAGLNAGDVTISCDVEIGAQDTAATWDAAGLRVGTQLWGDGWRPRAVAWTPIGESVVAGDELTLDDPHRIAARWTRATGTLELLVDNTVVNDTSAGEDRQLVNALPVWRAAIPPSSKITNCAVWSKVVEGEPPSPWSPLDLSGLVGWYDAADASTFSFSAGTVVSQWRDKSGLDRHLGSVSGSPSRSGSHNGLATVVFATGDRAYYGGAPGFFGGGITIIAVWVQAGTLPTTLSAPIRTTNSSNLGAPVDRWQTASNNQLIINNVGAAMSLNMRGATSWFVHTISVLRDPTSTPNAHEIVERANGSVVTSTTLSAVWQPSDYIVAGRRLDNGTSFVGQLGEAILVSGALHDSDPSGLAAAEAYLAAKWGVTL